MPQTLLAVCAIMAFSFFALGQHKSNAELERKAITSEIELAATDIARDQLVAITSHVYDEVDVDRTDLRRDAVGLSALLGPDAGESSIEFFDDLDDFNAFNDTLSVEWHGTNLTFAVTANVRYVDANQPETPSASPSLAKEVVVSVTEVRSENADRPNVSASLAHVITPVWTTIHG
ncbi:MAG: hypothetical protein R3284_02245 [Rubricoccaceae bacterium]|nr:hypothetical protein [Rubricoccaceae bacterium]